MRFARLFIARRSRGQINGRKKRARFDCARKIILCVVASLGQISLVESMGQQTRAKRTLIDRNGISGSHKSNSVLRSVLFGNFVIVKQNALTLLIVTLIQPIFFIHVDSTVLIAFFV